MTDMDKIFDNGNSNTREDYDLDVPEFLKKDKTVMTKNEYESMVKNSTSGLPVKAKPSKMKKVNKKRVKKAFVTICCTCMIFGAVAFQSAKSLIKGVEDYFEIFDALNDFRTEAIVDNTYRVNSLQDYAYNYDKIAEHVKTDEDVYLLYGNLGESQSNKVLEYVDGINSIQDFLNDHNYKNINEWSKVSNQQILLKNEITSKQEQLNKMTENYNINTDVAQTSTELGGK